VESKLAEAASKQIPLNPNVKAKLPPQILTPSQARPLLVDFERAADLWMTCSALYRMSYWRAGDVSPPVRNAHS